MAIMPNVAISRAMGGTGTGADHPPIAQEILWVRRKKSEMPLDNERGPFYTLYGGEK